MPSRPKLQNSGTIKIAFIVVLKLLTASELVTFIIFSFRLESSNSGIKTIVFFNYFLFFQKLLDLKTESNSDQFGEQLVS